MARILQFTDLHFRQALAGHSGHLERLSRHAPLLLQSLKQRIELEAPDLVAFTGDIIDAPHDLLVDKGKAASTELTEAVRKDYSTMRQWLDDLGVPWMISPGNHDYKPVFMEVFADSTQSLELPNLTAVRYFDWEVTDNTAERQGDQRSLFDAAVADGREDRWTLHLQHFLIWPEVVHGYPMRYREADQLRDLLGAARGRHMVLSGHFHEGTGIIQHGNGFYAVCRSITEAPHYYRVFDLLENQWTMREETLPLAPLAQKALLLIDRTDLLYDQRETHSLALSPETGTLFTKASEAGYEPILVSTWNDSQLLGLTWRDVLSLHDRWFSDLDGAGTSQGAGLIITIDEGLPLPARLPHEPLSRFGNLAARVEAHYGVSRSNQVFVSTDASRRALFGEEHSIASIEQLQSRWEDA